MHLWHRVGLTVARRCPKHHTANGIRGKVMSKTDNVDLYGNAYGHFATSVLEQIRLETYGEDIGQSGWMTADEYRWFFELLELDAASLVVDICSGSGGPAIFTAETTG